MNAPAPITTVLARLRPETRRECELVAKRAAEGLTFNEATELLRLQRAAQLAADEAAEARQEGRLLRPYRANPHEP